jgi:formate hydrogenlyase subunit 3/multisubunit Na+/H+ antiporter MnhD subunit
LVHFPIVLVMLLPVVAAVTLWAIGRGAKPTKAWLVPVAVAVALSLSAWLSVETGEQQEERVEKVVSEAAMETHADAAERFLLLTVAMAGLVAAGLINHRVGAVARGASLVAAVGLVFAGYQVGHSGGQLVYQHGAASAYLDALGEPRTTGERAGGDDDDRK